MRCSCLIVTLKLNQITWHVRLAEQRTAVQPERRQPRHHHVCPHQQRLLCPSLGGEYTLSSKGFHPSSVALRGCWNLLVLQDLLARNSHYVHVQVLHDFLLICLPQLAHGLPHAAENKWHTTWQKSGKTGLKAVQRMLCIIAHLTYAELHSYQTMPFLPYVTLLCPLHDITCLLSPVLPLMLCFLEVLVTMLLLPTSRAWCDSTPSLLP